MDNFKETMEATLKTLATIEEKMVAVSSIEEKLKERVAALEERAQGVYDLNNNLSGAISHFENAVTSLQETLQRIPAMQSKIEEVSKTLDSLNLTELKQSLDDASSALDKSLEKIKSAEALKNDSSKKTILHNKKKR